MFLGDNILETELHRLKTKKFKKITVLIDGSETSRKTAETPIQLGKKFDANVTIIYRINLSKIFRAFPHPDRVISPQQLEMGSIMKIQAHSFLFELEKMCNKLGVNVETKLIKDIPYLKIIKKANHNDLIVIGIKEKCLEEELFFLVFSEKILNNAHSSVMFVR